MNLIGTGFDGGVDDSAGGVAELRTVAARLDLELGERIRRRTDAETGAVQKVDGIRVVVYAVENEVILLRALAVCVEVALYPDRARHSPAPRLR